MKHLCSRRMLAYEVRNILGNPFIPFFGIVFPILMLFLISRVVTQDVPEYMVSEVNTSVFLTMSLIIPMAVLLLGYSAAYSQELEKQIPLRMKLFGYSQKQTLSARIAAQMLVLTSGLILYTAIGYFALEIEVPKASSAVCLIVCIYVLGIIFIVLAHAVANLLGKFGPTYAAMMIFYP